MFFPIAFVVQHGDADDADNEEDDMYEQVSYSRPKKYYDSHQEGDESEYDLPTYNQNSNAWEKYRNATNNSSPTLKRSSIAGENTYSSSAAKEMKYETTDSDLDIDLDELDAL